MLAGAPLQERLDFSCALFGPDGSLVANAPHLPVHLGAMSEAVRFQVRYYGPGGPGQAEGLQVRSPPAQACACRAAAPAAAALLWQEGSPHAPPSPCVHSHGISRRDSCHCG